MTHPDITALEALSRDYSETPRRVLFVLGSGKSPALEVFEAAAQQRSTSIDPQHLAEMAAGRRRSLTFCTPMQMVPEIVRKGVVHQRLRPMPASLWKRSSRKSARPVLGSMRATRQSSCSQLIVTVMAVSSRGSRENRLVMGKRRGDSEQQHPAPHQKAPWPKPAA